MIQVDRDEPLLVNQIIRVAILGLGIDTMWAALQSPGWQESQLLRLQRAWETPQILSNLFRSFEFEGADRLYQYETFRTSSYKTWVARYEGCFAEVNAMLPMSAVPPVQTLRHWCTHPIWSYAWAEREESVYGKALARELDAMRLSLRNRSWVQLDGHLQLLYDSYRPPWAEWRFYGKIPMLEDMSQVVAPSSTNQLAPASWQQIRDAVFDKLDFTSKSKVEYPYPNFKNAWAAAFRHLTEQQMLLTAIALERFRLQRGQFPSDLQSLIPQYLKSPPIDFMCGHPLRYRRDAGGTYLLYSVGLDGKDNGGDPTRIHKAAQGKAMWAGRDAIWPKAATPAPLSVSVNMP